MSTRTSRSEGGREGRREGRGEGRVADSAKYWKGRKEGGREGGREEHVPDVLLGRALVVELDQAGEHLGQVGA